MFDFISFRVSITNRPRLERSSPVERLLLGLQSSSERSFLRRPEDRGHYVTSVRRVTLSRPARVFRTLQKSKGGAKRYEPRARPVSLFTITARVAGDNSQEKLADPQARRWLPTNCTCIDVGPRHGSDQAHRPAPQGHDVIGRTKGGASGRNQRWSPGTNIRVAVVRREGYDDVTRALGGPVRATPTHKHLDLAFYVL